MTNSHPLDMDLDTVPATKLLTADTADILVLVGPKYFVHVQVFVAIEVHIALVAEVVFRRFHLGRLHLPFRVEGHRAVLVRTRKPLDRVQYGRHGASRMEIVIGSVAKEC